MDGEKLEGKIIDEITISNVFNNEYFKINTVLQKIVGLWPYQGNVENLIKRFFVILVLSIFTVPHINGIRVWCGRNLGLCAENISGVVYASGVCVKYFVVVTSQKKTAMVYKQVTLNWLTITEPGEKDILKDYANLGRLKSIGYVGYVSIAAVCFSQMGLIPALIDIIIPLNESRPKLIPVKGEFFIDPLEHYWYIYFAYCLVTVISTAVLMAIDTTYTAIVHQNLGIFNVIKYRLRMAKHHANTDKDIAYENIISAVRLHQDSLQLSNRIVDDSNRTTHHEVQNVTQFAIDKQSPM